jgi:hypothetical protein
MNSIIENTMSSEPKSYIFLNKVNKRLLTNNLTLPDSSVPFLTCKVEISPGVYLYGLACSNYIFVDSNPIKNYDVENNYKSTRQTIEVDPFFTAEGIGKAYHVKATHDHWSYGYNRPHFIYDSYYHEYNYASRSHEEGIPYNYLKIKVSFMGESKEEVFKFQRPNAGIIELNDSSNDILIKTSFFGIDSIFNWRIKNSYYAWNDLIQKLESCEIEDTNKFLIKFFHIFTKNDESGISAAEKRKEIKKSLDRLKSEEPLLWSFYCFLKNSKTKNKVSNNRLLSSVLLDCGADYNKLKKQIETVLKSSLDKKELETIDNTTRSICMQFPTAIQAYSKIKEKAEWNLRVGLQGQAEGLGIDATKHSKLFKAVIDGKIALSLFHTTGDPLNLINVEFDLWEKALRRKGWDEVIFQNLQFDYQS